MRPGTAADAAAASNRRPLLVLLVLFIAPLALAFWLYYGSSWRPLRRTNHGELIQPVVTLPPLAPPAAAPGDAAPASLFQGKWSLVVLAAGAGAGSLGCDADCRNALIYARQTWLSLGKLAPRVQRVLLAGAGCCDREYLQREHTGLITVPAADPAAARVLGAVPLPHDHAIFVVDPLGNLMMRYDVRQDPKGLREDLKKLLELSHIG
jgi:hypothetical protein